MNYVYQGSPNESSEVQRSGLHQLLGELQAGDCLAVTSLSGVADSSASLLELLDDLKQRGIRFRSVEEGADGTPLTELTEPELLDLWQRAKQKES